MSDFSGISGIVEQIRESTDNITKNDQRLASRVDSVENRSTICTDAKAVPAQAA